MGPKLFGFKMKETLYSVRLFPVGGFCRMADNTDEESLKYGKIGFNDANVYKRLVICVAGPIMNFVLALIVMVILVSLTGISTSIVSTVSDDTPAQEAGLMPGDKIISVNGSGIHSADDLDFYKVLHPGEEMNLVVKRNGEKINLSLVPQLVTEDGQDYYMMGVMLVRKAPLLGKTTDETVKGEFYEYISGGYWQMISLVKLTAYSFKMLFTGGVSVNELSGPIGVTAAVDQVYDAAMEAGETRAMQVFSVFVTMSNLMALLSANLGVINLFPLPALDGGHIIIYIAEIISRKRIPPEKEGKIHLVGFVLMMALGVFIAINDVIKLIG
jgi:regulator of sigma E protease